MMKKLVKKCMCTDFVGNIVRRMFLFHFEFNRNRLFEYRDTKLSYFLHSYNNVKDFGYSERSIEVPIVLHEAKGARRILEIGNVGKHYYDEFKHLDRIVLDKYELAHDVVNMDIIDMKVDDKFDYIFSISTFEHMDSDGGRNPDFVVDVDSEYLSNAFINAKHVVDELLVCGGRFLMTVPIGYENREIDSSIFGGDIDKLGCECLVIGYKRIGPLEWQVEPIENMVSFNELEHHKGRQRLAALIFTKPIAS